MDRKGVARYQQIAVDLASRIVKGHFKEGDTIFARSSLASYYNVSSETARRAISVLQGMQIVVATQGSGVKVVSVENAMKYIRQFEDIQTIEELKQDILTRIDRLEQENRQLKEHLLELIDKTDRFNSFNPFLPFEITLTKDTPYLNKTPSEINFWQNTNATIIAIKHSGDLVLSPGPDVKFQEKDVLYFIGDENSMAKVSRFLYPNKDKGRH